ncbi:hypothetical protein [Exiguobacterium sp. s149]|uniref:hypothetical protein n=1 Tax=Exiguobacterium TaxID=33986 RepID=UPI001BE6EAF5|nr:hypothetical protein [Exiguobacterium sp. s149]
MNPYELLNVTPLSRQEELEAAYRELCNRYPKDTHPEERLLVDEAYKNIMAERDAIGSKVSASPVNENHQSEETPSTADPIAHQEIDEKTAEVIPFKKKRKWPIVLGFIATLLLGMWLSDWMNSDTEYNEYVYESETDASADESSESSEPIEAVDEETENAEVAKEEAEAKEREEREKREMEERQKEEAIELVNEWSPTFFYEVQYALANRSTSNMEMTTAKFRNEFQPTLTKMVDTNVIFEGEIETAPIHKGDLVEVGQNRIVAKVNTDYSSLSYSPYLRDEPEGARIEWQLTFVNQGGDWVVDERKLLSDTSKGRIDPVRDEVKEDIVDTIDTNASDWLNAYRNKDTSYFSKIRFSEYYDRQESYYKTLDKNNWYWEGDYLGLDYSYDSIVIEETNPLKATIEARASYQGDYYDEDTQEFAELDDSEPSVFRYSLEYDYDDQSWYIVNTKLLKKFSKGDVRSYSHY